MNVICNKINKTVKKKKKNYYLKWWQKVIG
jgi:hypothetical protein